MRWNRILSSLALLPCLAGFALAQGPTTQPVAAVPASLPVELKLPAILSPGMVLQQDKDAVVWGWARPGDAVEVKLDKESARATADAEGKWQVRMKTPPAGGPYEMTVTAGGKTIPVNDILVGEVWVCSGQSNMEFAVRSATNAVAEIEKSNCPQIRHFAVKKDTSSTPVTDCTGQWSAATPLTTGSFTAVGYFFGRNLHEQLKVPVGLIHSSWGGTVAEAWTPEQPLQADPNFASMLERDRQAMLDYPAKYEEWQQAMKKYKELVQKGEILEYQKDPGNTGAAQGWASADGDLAAWKPAKMLGMWQETLNLKHNGAVWFRKEVNVPADWQGQDLRLNLGALDDFDTTYFNGTKVGGIGEENPDAYKTVRSYLVPGSLVKAGKNVLAIRIFDHYGNGGFAGPLDKMTLQPDKTVDGAKPLALANDWQYRVELALDPNLITGPGKKAPREPAGAKSPNRPAVLYNAMIAPIVPFPIRGAIWYQGEANAGRAEQYRTLLPIMIKSWRAAWQQPEFPFLIVQLANYMAPASQPTESEWAELREAQMLTTRALPNVGLATAIDIGEANDIHPKNKQEVGRRLALAAMNQVYGRKMVGSGPVFDRMTVEGDTIRLFFKNNVGMNWENCGNLVAKDGALKGFAIAGADKKFVWAEAKIDGATVVVKSAQVPQPVAVRYDWANNPDGNLYNAEGLPTLPFRTDDWPGLTAGKK